MVLCRFNRLRTIFHPVVMSFDVLPCDGLFVKGVLVCAGSFFVEDVVLWLVARCFYFVVHTGERRVPMSGSWRDFMARKSIVLILQT